MLDEEAGQVQRAYVKYRINVHKNNREEHGFGRAEAGMEVVEGVRSQLQYDTKVEENVM